MRLQAPASGGRYPLADLQRIATCAWNSALRSSTLESDIVCTHEMRWDASATFILVYLASGASVGWAAPLAMCAFSFPETQQVVRGCIRSLFCSRGARGFAIVTARALLRVLFAGVSNRRFA